MRTTLVFIILDNSETIIDMKHNTNRNTWNTETLASPLQIKTLYDMSFFHPKEKCIMILVKPKTYGQHPKGYDTYY